VAVVAMNPSVWWRSGTAHQGSAGGMETAPPTDAAGGGGGAGAVGVNGTAPAVQVVQEISQTLLGSNPTRLVVEVVDYLRRTSGTGTVEAAVLAVSNTTRSMLEPLLTGGGGGGGGIAGCCEAAQAAQES
jgi:hypothetical protein